MKNIKIGIRLIVSYLLVAMVAEIIGIIGCLGLKQINDASTALYQADTQPIPYVSAVVENVRALDSELKSTVIFYDDAAKLAEAEQNITTYTQNYEKNVKLYEPTITNPVARKRFDEATQLYSSQLKPAIDTVLADVKAGNADQAKTDLFGDDLTKAVTTMLSDYNECMNRNVTNANSTLQSNVNLWLTLRAALMIIIAIGVGGSIILGIYMSRVIGKPVGEMAKAAQKIAQGNLDVSITYAAKNELGILADSLRSTIATLKLYINDISTTLGKMAAADISAEVTQEYIGDFIPIQKAMQEIAVGLNETLAIIRTTGKRVSSGSEMVSNGAQALSQGTAEQASSIEELAASITEVSGNVQKNADNVRLAADSVVQAVNGISMSNQQMQGMLAAMDGISSSSNDISKIIKVIDDIAFQTNILALNAAVEAARAGAAGKGFAVVADEVRSLASKSADAAKQTTTLIEDSIRSVEEGSHIADETATALADVSEKSQFVKEIIEKIDQASQEQATAIYQITQGIDQISAVVQTNSATAEESAAASEELSGQSKRMDAIVAHFKLNAAFANREM